MILAPTIHINGRFLTQPQTGVQRYAHEIIEHFDALLDENEFKYRVKIVCLVPKGTSAKKTWKNVVIEETGINQGNIWEQIDLPLRLRGGFLFSPTNTGPLLYSNQAITFHDASVFAVPHTYSLPFRSKYKLIFWSLAWRAQVIFTDSTFSQLELSYYLKCPTDRFQVIPLAGDHITRINPDIEILKKFNLTERKYILAVGSQSPHKNMATIHKVAKSIDKEIKVAFAGGKYEKVFNKYVNDTPAENTVNLGYITDEQLKALYMNALVYICPSYYEGFGLPILEAMECGCPVICARAASLPETAGDAALLFSPTDTIEIVQMVNNLFQDQELRQALIQRGHQHARKFKWGNTAYNILQTLYTSAKAQT